MSGNIFDNMGDEAQGEFTRNSNSERFTVQFGTEHIDVPFRDGTTVRDAFMQNADFLGFDTDRILAYRDNHNNLLDGNEQVEPGVVYTASITHDEKG